MPAKTVPRSASAFARWATLLLALFVGLFVSSCATEEEGDQYLSWDLNPTLSAYDRVLIELVEPDGSDVVIETVWNAKIPEPSRFPKYRLGPAKGRKFLVRIRGYNANGDLLHSREVIIDVTRPGAPVTRRSDLRLHGLVTDPTGLTPAFSPDAYAYSLQLPADKSSFSLTALPMDDAARLTVNGEPATWNEARTLDLVPGANPVSLVLSDSLGRESNPYLLMVNRGEVVSPDKVTSVAVTPRTLVLYTRDTSATLTAAVEPIGAAVGWTSQNEDVVVVDVTGRVSPRGAGSTTVTAKAGAFSDRADVEVRQAPPVLDIGTGIGVKVGTEVEFKIVLSLTKATVVSFKYWFEGGDRPENSDTTMVPASVKHVYATKGSFEARFEVKDSRGNTVTRSRTISVGDADRNITILEPADFATVRTSPVTIRYLLGETEITRQEPLKEGLNDIVIDTMGASARVRIYLDTTPPKAPLVEINSPTAELRPSWRWKTGGDGAGQFRSSLDSAGLSAAAASSALSFIPGADLAPGAHTLFVQERDSAGNWSEPGKATVSVLAPDRTPPEAPKVIGTSPTNEAPKWTWSTGGGDGTGDFRWKLDDTALSVGAAETREKSHTLANGVSGKTYTLYVQERDASGNWSKSGSHAVEFDQTKPGVSIVAPQSGGTYITRADKLTLSGKASGPRTIARVAYQLGSGTPTNATFSGDAWSVTDLPLAEGTLIFSVTAYDDLGNPSTAQSITLKRDATLPNPPIILSSPATPSKAGRFTWTWSPGSDNTGGSGLSGLYRYSLNGGATWTEINASLLSDITVQEGTVTLLLQEQDFAENWSTSATSTIVVDCTAPKVVISSPEKSGTLTSVTTTSSGTTSDVGTGIASVVVTGQNSGNGIATVTGGTWSTGNLTLRAGKDTLIVTATDLVGNTATDTAIVTVNIPVPQVRITYPAPNFATNKDTLSVRYRVDEGAEQTSSPFSLTTEGTISLTVTVPNGPGTPGTATVEVFRDITPPNAPVVSTTARWTQTSPAWTWASGGDNTNGSGLASTLSYQYQVNGGAWTQGTPASHSLPNPAEGPYTLIVQQLDRAGNWSANSNAVLVTVDRTAPVVTVKSPANNYVTSASSFPLECRVDNVDQAAVTTNIVEGTNTATCAKTDSAGNTGSQPITVWRRANVLFVRSGGTGNASTSNSWATAFGSIQAAITAAASSSSLQKQIWVAGGTYATSVGINLKTGISIFGGFSPTAFGHALTSRAFGASDTVRISSTLANGSDALFYMTGTNVAPILNDTLDGLLFRVISGQRALKYDFARKAQVNNCQFVMSNGSYSGITGWGSEITLQGIRMSGMQGFGLLVHAEPGGTGFTGILAVVSSVFSGNTMSAGGDLAFIRSTVATTTITGSELRDAVAGGGFHLKGSGTSLTLTGNTVRGVSGNFYSGTWTNTPTVSGNTFVVNF